MAIPTLKSNSTPANLNFGKQPGQDFSKNLKNRGIAPLVSFKPWSNSQIPQFLKNIPNIEKAWPIIQRAPGALKWLSSVAVKGGVDLIKGAVVTVGGFTLAQIAAALTLAVGFIAVFAPPAGTKDEFPNLDNFFKNVDGKLLSKFSKLLADKGVSVDQALKLFKGAKPDNAAKAMEKIIALSDDPTWKKSLASKQKQINQLKLLLPELSHDAKDSKSLPLILGVKEFALIDNKAKAKAENDIYMCSARVTVWGNYGDHSHLITPNHDPETGEVNVEVVGIHQNSGARLPVRILKYPLLSTSDHFMTEALKYTVPSYENGTGSMNLTFPLTKKLGVITQAQCNIDGAWHNAVTSIDNNSENLKHNAFSATMTDYGVEVKSVLFKK